MSDRKASSRRSQFLAATLSVGLLPFLTVLADAASPERHISVAVITHIQRGLGRAEVRPLGAGAWTDARPLRALRAGDEVRASDDAVLVLLLAGGRGRHIVTALNSPYVVVTPPMPQRGTPGKLQVLLQRSLSFLLASSNDGPEGALGSRGGPGVPVILSNGLVLPSSLVFHWQAQIPDLYTVSILSRGGVVWQQDRVNGGVLEYPVSKAPVLEPSIQYTLRVRPVQGRAKEAHFEVLDPARAELVRQELAYLRSELSPEVTDRALVAIEAAYLADHILLHDARLTVLRAVQTYPDEPSFHLLLAELYTRMGLPDQAIESRRKAKTLLSVEADPSASSSRLSQ